MNPPHPAKYTKAFLPQIANMLAGCRNVIDPFGGTGERAAIVFDMMAAPMTMTINEIEFDWHKQLPQRVGLVGVHGDATALPFPDGHFDGAFTSPTYGNRMADHFKATTPKGRNTYRHKIGHELDAQNTGRMQWGKKYKALHVAAWRELARVLSPGSPFVLNIKDHYRAGHRQYVTAWHINTLQQAGFVVIEHRHIRVPSLKFGANRRRMPYESLILCQLQERS